MTDGMEVIKDEPVVVLSSDAQRLLVLYSPRDPRLAQSADVRESMRYLCKKLGTWPPHPAGHREHVNFASETPCRNFTFSFSHRDGDWCECPGGGSGSGGEGGDVSVGSCSGRGGGGGVSGGGIEAVGSESKAGGDTILVEDGRREPRLMPPEQAFQGQALPRITARSSYRGNEKVVRKAKGFLEGVRYVLIVRPPLFVVTGSRVFLDWCPPRPPTLPAPSHTTHPPCACDSLRMLLDSLRMLFFVRLPPS